MSTDDVELVKRAWTAVRQRDLDSFLEVIDPEIEFNTLIAEAEGTVFRGHAGIREWWEVVAGSMGVVRFDIQEFRDLDNGVLTRLVAIGNVGGVDVPQAMFHVSRIRNGKCFWWGVYRTEREALDALAEQS